MGLMRLTRSFTFSAYSAYLSRFEEADERTRTADLLITSLLTGVLLLQANALLLAPLLPTHRLPSLEPNSLRTFFLRHLILKVCML